MHVYMYIYAEPSWDKFCIFIILICYGRRRVQAQDKRRLFELQQIRQV